MSQLFAETKKQLESWLRLNWLVRKLIQNNLIFFFFCSFFPQEGNTFSSLFFLAPFLFPLIAFLLPFAMPQKYEAKIKSVQELLVRTGNIFCLHITSIPTPTQYFKHFLPKIEWLCSPPPSSRARHNRRKPRLLQFSNHPDAYGEEIPTNAHSSDNKTHLHIPCAFGQSRASQAGWLKSAVMGWVSRWLSPFPKCSFHSYANNLDRQYKQWKWTMTSLLWQSC